MAINWREAKSKTGLTGAPDGLDEMFAAFCETYTPAPLLRREWLEAFGRTCGADDKALGRLNSALDDIENKELLHTVAAFLAADICEARHRLDTDDYKALHVEGMEDGELFSFLVLLACVEPSMNRLAKRGVPLADYEDIPRTPARRQFEKLVKKGDGAVADFPWDMNFYSCSIFLIDRFYFIPFRLDEDLRVWRRGNETMAFYAGEVNVRRDGELDGVNGQHDEAAFTAAYEETAHTITGCPIHPAGIILNEKATLNKSEWTKVLEKGSILLGFHIPSGPGYDIQHLKSSALKGREFFEKWFPEFDICGYGSESWLYDPHLAHVLNGKGNICEMQKQMYVYPIESGDGMAMQELFHAKELTEETELRTSLHKAAAAYIKSGRRFTVSSMFILYADLQRIGEGPYAPGGEYEAVWQKMGQ